MSKNGFVEDHIAMVSIDVVSIFRLISNIISSYITRMSSRFHNAFGVLCSSFLICNVQAIFVLFTRCTIVLSVKSPALSSPRLFFVRLIGLFLNGGWFGSLLMHFFTALNRFYAFVYATKYNQLWSQSNAFKIVIIAWIFSMVYCTHHLYNDCALLFNEGQNYRWLHHASLGGEICADIDAATSIGIVMAMACFDFTTLIKILAYRRAVRRNIEISTGDTINESEILFFKQSCKLGLLYISCILAFNITPHFFSNKWILFISSTIALILAHSLDGLTFLVFNRHFICKRNFSATSVSPITNVI